MRAVLIPGHVGEDWKYAVRRAGFGSLRGGALHLAAFARRRRHYCGAGAGKPKRHCAAEPASAAGNDRDTAGECFLFAHGQLRRQQALYIRPALGAERLKVVGEIGGAHVEQSRPETWTRFYPLEPLG